MCQWRNCIVSPRFKSLSWNKLRETMISNSFSGYLSIIFFGRVNVALLKGCPVSHISWRSERYRKEWCGSLDFKKSLDFRKSFIKALSRAFKETEQQHHEISLFRWMVKRYEIDGRSERSLLGKIIQRVIKKNQTKTKPRPCFSSYSGIPGQREKQWGDEMNWYHGIIQNSKTKEQLQNCRRILED